MNPENIMLCEVTQRDTYCVIPLIGGAKANSQKVEWWSPGAGSGGSGGGCCLMGTGHQLGKTKKFWRGMGMAAQQWK